MKTLSSYVEQISDDFQSTFTVVDKNTLANMLGHEGDFEQLLQIIHRYLPGVLVQFEKTNQIPGSYDVYLIKAVSNF